MAASRQPRQTAELQGPENPGMRLLVAPRTELVTFEKSESVSETLHRRVWQVDTVCHPAVGHRVSI